MPPNKHKEPPFLVALCVCRLRTIRCEHAKSGFGIAVGERICASRLRCRERSEGHKEAKAHRGVPVP